MKIKEFKSIVLLLACLTMAWQQAVAQGTLYYEPQQRYADHSVLAQGRWVKIRVPESGVYQLTGDLIRQAGFTDLSRVHVYGYGGAMQPERLTAAYLQQTDDLKEVALCADGDSRYFYAVGPVTWEQANSTVRLRNPYSMYGYYFLTENDAAPQTQSKETFLSTVVSRPEAYHSLYEQDDYAWFHSGRNLYDARELVPGGSYSYTLPASSADGVLTVSMSYDLYFEVEVSVNDRVVGTMLISAATQKSSATKRPYPDDYSKAAADIWTFDVEGLTPQSVVNFRVLSGNVLRLDYLSLSCTEPRPAPELVSGQLPVPELVGDVACQDHHADTPVDMVIIIPSSGLLLSEAQRLAQLHEQYDGMRTRIVPADELYNEFSSGTPDANAYRRYLKMLYDRATSVADRPSYLLLFGDGAWDNRMLSSNWRNTRPDDFLLCYESENSFSSTKSYVTDDYFCLLNDGEGSNMLSADLADVAVGRLPARTQAEAALLVDKIYSYITNEKAGSWQNVVCFMADDGNKNMHMEGADEVATALSERFPALQLRKVYWDAYQRSNAASGSRYPDATRLIQAQMEEGALLMNYTGHGGSSGLSHENVVVPSDFNRSSDGRLPFWFTASCDILPFDGQEANIGEIAMFNPTGGAIAIFGTARTVYAEYNLSMNKTFTKYLFGTDEDGRLNTIGQAILLAKHEIIAPTDKSIKRDLTENKLHYNLLGDPALRLALPTEEAVVDQINGEPVWRGVSQVVAGHTVTVRGHINGHNDFSGTATITVLDAAQTIVCRVNSKSDADKPKAPFEFTDRLNTIYKGSNRVENAEFIFTFPVPLDNSYSDNPCLLHVYAVSDDHTIEANGVVDAFTVISEQMAADNPQGPDITCQMDYPVFTSQLYDEDGINVSGSGIGHDMELIIDGKIENTYCLNNYFQYDFGDYRSGNVKFTLPWLSEGEHYMLFRAWDVLNHSSVAEYSFMVSASYTPSAVELVNYEPLRHVEVFDVLGRKLPDARADYRSQRRGLFLYRDANGVVKKKMVGGQ